MSHIEKLNALALNLNFWVLLRYADHANMFINRDNAELRKTLPVEEYARQKKLTK